MEPEVSKDILTDHDLNRLQLTTLQYYLHESNPANGLVRDKTEHSAPASIAAVGLALASLPIIISEVYFQESLHLSLHSSD